MKYLITESQKENIIKKYILSNFDRVDDVWFITRSVYYGSGSVNGKDRGEEIIINIFVDNSSREDSLTN
jgi:transcription antitermination factor NusG